ncbi:MAG TPA: 50S ribosomal protein L3 [Methanospirillum sp.]|uniref:50S ribosomal protein L3 n=1 Tax=Methanospirillum sp. TaxID=45200 RepID=UPI002C8AC6D3|nr:50S ribosomal protein L3 [Methanospirillum sp.]HOJ96864.1 50S ribosomal protein L3 [Methanospirillum sp.]HOL40264.1 50S ribosomal protein L3 [Methanospirillum sp.]HPP77446.1 50S ribosomal protein L3 [Methanospirillum sp.]
MPNIHRPRLGSLAYSPRKRAKSPVPKYHAWPAYQGEPALQGFAGYKVGMTHVIMADDHAHSPNEGKDIMVPVTVIEVPDMRVAAIRVYRHDTYGNHVLTEVWADSFDKELGRRLNLPKNNKREEAEKKIREALEAGKIVDVVALTYTRPSVLTGVPKKVPDLMETRIDGGSMTERFEYGLSILGKDVDVRSLFKVGQYTDVTAITKGKGTQGPVKRWGVHLRKRKHSRGKKERHVGTLGPWTPHHVRWQVPMMGQMGYHQRTEFNKRLLKIGEDGAEITPEGGFINYGEVRARYVLIKGSIPGPSKRLVRIRHAMRLGEHKIREPTIGFVSLASKQG